MSLFNTKDTVKIKQHIWGKPNPPQGVIVKRFVFDEILNGQVASTERQFECAIRDGDKCNVGYDVYWPHNGTTNPWSEYELEKA